MDVPEHGWSRSIDLWIRSAASFGVGNLARSRGELPAEVIYEDEWTIAFTAHAPVTAGHTLVIPKTHFENLFDITDQLAAAIGLATKATGIALLDRHTTTGINVLHASGADAQQSVFHFHQHVVPRRPHDGLDMWLRVMER